MGLAFIGKLVALLVDIIDVEDETVAADEKTRGSDLGNSGRIIVEGGGIIGGGGERIAAGGGEGTHIVHPGSEGVGRLKGEERCEGTEEKEAFIHERRNILGRNVGWIQR